MLKNTKLSLFFFCLFSVLCLLFSAVAEANIVVRAAVINPSQTQKRTIPFKSYLPKEIKPEHIVDMGELEIAYDPKESAYYVYKDFELGPRESVLVEIEMKDVWKISAEEMASIREETDKVMKLLENTDYFERAKYLRQSIEDKLTQIERTQTLINPNPGGYISDYRENVKLLDAVKIDLQAAKTLMSEAKQVSPMLTWKLIIAIVAFLGLLGFAFFMIWLKQMKTISNLTEDFKTPQPEGPQAPVTSERTETRQAEAEKKSDMADIEERLKQ